MADIDMIPRSARAAVRARRTLAAYGTALALLAVLGGGTAAVLRWRLAVETPRLELARAGATQADAVRSRLIEAQGRKDALAVDVGALAALRGTGETAALARVLDAALDDRVWFEQLRFSHTCELLKETPAAPAPDIVLAPAGTAGTPGALQAWRLGSHLEINARALDHAAMSAFLDRVAADPALANVRFLNSSAAAEEGGVVAFGVAAALRSKERPHE